MASRAPRKVAPRTSKKKLRLVKVVLQPVFVVDDGKTLAEMTVDPVQIAGADWPSYTERHWPKAVADLEAQVNGAKVEPSQ
jgi:hypothetical protein